VSVFLGDSAGRESHLSWGKFCFFGGLGAGEVKTKGNFHFVPLPLLASSSDIFHFPALLEQTKLTGRCLLPEESQLSAKLPRIFPFVFHSVFLCVHREKHNIVSAIRIST